MHNLLTLTMTADLYAESRGKNPSTKDVCLASGKGLSKHVSGCVHSEARPKNSAPPILMAVTQ